MADKNRTVSLQLTTSKQDVYIAPPSFKATVDSILITNGSSTAKTVTMEWWNKTTDTATAVLDTTSIPANSFIQIRWSMAIDQDDILRALASSASAVTITIRATETYTTSTL